MPTVITPTLERTCERSCNSDTSNTLDIPIPRGYTKYNSPYHQVPLIENNKDKVDELILKKSIYKKLIYKNYCVYI